MHFRRLLTSFLLVSWAAAVWGQMTPNAPVKNFSLPRFGESGFTEWVLRGAKGIYDGPEQVRVEDMSLRIYTGDERMLKEMSLVSPSATIRLEENRAFSEEAIEIEGTNFRISGTGWEWIGATREIVVKADTRVEFAESISGGFGPMNPDGQRRPTTIKSNQLVLQATETEYNFEFNGNVHASSADWEVSSHLLIVLADAPEGTDEKVALPEEASIQSVHRITAKEDISFVQAGRKVEADQAVLLPREERVTLTGSPTIEVDDSFLSGDVIETRAGEVVIKGTPGEARAQMILMQTGGLGIEGVAALSSDTILLADTITMRETETGHNFVFEGRVETYSGELELTADKMQVDTEKRQSLAGRFSSEGSIPVGDAKELSAGGNVRIEQAGRIATADEVTFYPDESRAVLSGSPSVTNSSATVTGARMELKPDLAIVRGDGDIAVTVELPDLPDLGYRESSEVEMGENEREESLEVTVPTMIQSQLLNMIGEADRTVFRFLEAVQISATNLEASCERLDVIAVEREASMDASEESNSLSLETIEAYDSVRIQQGARIATAGRATILPNEGKLILEESASVEDPRGRVEGHRLTLHQGQQRAVVEGGGPEGERARITLPGFDQGAF